MQVELRLLGEKVHGLGNFGFFYEGGQGMSKCNLVCGAILYGINTWLEKKQSLPAHLHVQLDNAAADNKNHTVMGFLGHLVGLGIFTKVTVSLPV